MNGAPATAEDRNDAAARLVVTGMVKVRHGSAGPTTSCRVQAWTPQARKAAADQRQATGPIGLPQQSMVHLDRRPGLRLGQLSGGDQAGRPRRAVPMCPTAEATLEGSCR